MKDSSLISVESIEKAIYLIRGEKVILDRDLAELYEVETRVLNQAVGRNRDRFPSDFMFELTREEISGISQIVTSSNLRFSKRVTAFTEQGVAMLSSVLHSKRAVQVNIEIMRAFVRLRRMLASDSELSRRLNDLESKYDHQFKVVFDAIRQLMLPKQPGRKQIGFRSRSVKKQVDDACALIIGQSLLGTPQQPLVRLVLSRAIEVLFKSNLH
ncbi:MAG: hypothetical protein QOG23_3047 [Blastocatellia bacterium]|nr:hypothetical protein [Blastocatellia bacterium]